MFKVSCLPQEEPLRDELLSGQRTDDAGSLVSETFFSVFFFFFFGGGGGGRAGAGGWLGFRV